MPVKKSFSQLKFEIESKHPHLEMLDCDIKNTKSVVKFLDKECSKIFYRIYNAVWNSNYPGHPDNQQNRIESTWIEKYGVNNPRKVESIKEKSKLTCLKKYGVENPSQVKKIQDKVAKSMNSSSTLNHWKTNEEIFCVGKYEYYVVQYLNNNKIDFIWKPLDYVCSNGRHYFVDMYLPEKNIYVEIKGRFFSDAKLKWDEFTKSYPNSELWSKKELAAIGITDSVMYNRRKS